MRTLNVYITCGIPGAGKSYAAEEIADDTFATILCTDTIRGEIYGDESIQGDWLRVYSTLMKRAEEELREGYDVIIDSTAHNPQRRRKMIQRIKTNCRNLNLKFICVYVNTPVEIAKIRNQQRDRHVPDGEIEKMNFRFVPPTPQEGFDEIIQIDYK